MNRKTVRSVALSAFAIAISTLGISLPGRTTANTPVPSNGLSSTVIRVAQSTTSDTASLEASIFQKVNQYRASKGLKALTRNSSMDSQARIHSQNMANGTVPFGHQGFDARIRATQISYASAAENVAYNQGYSDPAKQAVDGWIRSNGHRLNMEGNFNLTGIGVATNSRGEVYFTQLFIRQR